MRPDASAWATAGRLLVGGYFLYNGVNHFRQPAPLSAYARSKGVSSPESAVALSGALITAGGLGLLMGRATRPSAGLIATFLVAVTPAMHAFWDAPDEAARQQDQIQFTKNVALLGAALLAAGCENRQ